MRTYDYIWKIATGQGAYQTFVSMKTSWRRLSSSSSEDVFEMSSRHIGQNEHIRLSHTSSGDVLLKTNIFVLTIRLEDVFETFSRRLAKASPRHVQDIFKMFLRHLQDILPRPLQCVFKTSSRRLQDVFKTFWRHLQDVL